MDGEASDDSNSCEEVDSLNAEPQLHSVVNESKEEEESDLNEVMDVEENNSENEESEENSASGESDENIEQKTNEEKEVSSQSEESSESEAVNEINEINEINELDESEGNSMSEENGEDGPSMGSTSSDSNSNSDSDSNSNPNSDSNSNSDSDSDSNSAGWKNDERKKLIDKMRREKLLALVTEQHKVLFDLLRKHDEENQSKGKYQFSEVSHDYLMPLVTSPHHYVFSEVLSSPFLEKPYLAKDRKMEIESHAVKVLPHLNEKGGEEEEGRKSGKEAATLFNTFSNLVGTNEDVAKDVLDVTGVMSGDSTENNDDEICLKESEWHVADSSDSAVYSLGDDLTHQQNSSSSSPVVISSESSSVSASPSISLSNEEEEENRIEEKEDKEEYNQKEEEQEQESKMEEEEAEENEEFNQKEEYIIEEENKMKGEKDRDEEQEENKMKEKESKEEKKVVEMPHLALESTENEEALNTIPPIDITDKITEDLIPEFEELSKQTRMEEDEAPVKAVEAEENREIVDIVDTEESQQEEEEEEESKEFLKIKKAEDSQVIDAAPIAKCPEPDEVEIIDVSDSSDSSSVSSRDKHENIEKEKEKEKTNVQLSKESPSLEVDSFKESTIDFSAIPEITSIPDPQSIVIPENVTVISEEQPSIPSDPFKSRFSLEQIDAILKPFSSSCEEPSKYQAKREAELKRLRQLPSKLVHRSFVSYCVIFSHSSIRP